MDLVSMMSMVLNIPMHYQMVTDRGRGEDQDIGTKTDIDGNPTVPGSGRNPLIANNPSQIWI